MTRDITIEPQGFVHLYDSMGSDLTTVNAARVSMNKSHSFFHEDADTKLINFLAEEEHTAPFRHNYATFHIRAPIFVFRQWMKHRIASDFNEISGRYVVFDMADMWVPVEWREQAENVKQGSAGAHSKQADLHAFYEDAARKSFETYDLLLRLGACREQARAILPLGLYSEVYWTASLQAIAHFIKLRKDGHAQKEIQDYADAVERICREIWPVSLDALLR